jgi:hypothetical protein
MGLSGVHTPVTGHVRPSDVAAGMGELLTFSLYLLTA